MKITGLPAIFLIWIIAATTIPASGFATDQVGIYFDQEYLQDHLALPDLPSVVTGYLVLKDPSSPYPLHGWECCAAVDGPADFIGWELEGQSINVMSPPCFTVGIGADYPPTGDNVLLATFQMLVTGPSLVELSLTPTSTPSIPGNMAYLCGEDGYEEIPMGTVSGEPIVASIISSMPFPVVEPAQLYFGTRPLESLNYLDLLVTNTGGGQLHLEVALDPDVADFFLPAGGGEFWLSGGESLTIQVGFTPSVVGGITSTLHLGTMALNVPLAGIGREPITAWEVSGSLDFGEVPLYHEASRAISIINTGDLPLPIVPTLNGDCPHFNLSHPDPVEIPAGSGAYIAVRYHAVDYGEFTCELDLGDVLPPVAMHATTFTPPPHVDIVPEILDFGDVPTGSPVTSNVTISNSTAGPLEVVPVIGEGCPEFQLVNPTPFTLPGNTSSSLSVTFQSAEVDSFSCNLELGTGVGTVPMTARTYSPQTSWLVTPDTLDFGSVVQFSWSQRAISIRNTGDLDILLNVSLQDTSGFFQLPGVQGEVVLEPAHTQLVPVALNPDLAGTFGALVSLGDVVPGVPVTGLVLPYAPQGEVSPTELDFQPTPVALWSGQTFTVLNTGNGTLTVEPETGSPNFLVQPASATIGVGDSREFTVVFFPQVEGELACDIDLGPFADSLVHCTGTGLPSGTTFNQNRIGIYFDTGYSHPNTEPPYDGQVEGYLVLKNASAGGVTGWECRHEVLGSGYMAGYTLNGNGYNSSYGGNFQVTLDEPLPPSEDVLLATFRYQVTDINHGIWLFLYPANQPFLPGFMAYRAGEEPGLILPLTTVTGDPQVAWVEGGAVSVDHLDEPVVTPQGGQVALNWDLPEGEFDGFHVFRRDETGPGVRLTVEPGTIDGDHVTFTDQPNGFAEGTILYYSYSLMGNGTESPVSREAEYQVGHAPPLITRLRPNVPNPFNPQTEIRFDLAAEGTVRVSIYDVSGRLVRDLESGRLAAGSYTRNWQGRDNRGVQAPSGVYYVRMVTGDRVDHRKITLVR